MDDLGLAAGYWKNLKKYYEEDYNGIMPGKYATGYAIEIEAGDASFLQLDRPFDPDDVITWIEDTEQMASDDYDEEVEADNETEIDFPGIYSYANYHEEIAAYFLHKDLDRFRDEISKGNKEFIDEAIKLEWTEMIEEIPDVKEMFLF